MDGHKQRQALTAAERALEHLSAGKPDDAERAAARASELDQIGIFSQLAEAVSLAATDLREHATISPDHVDQLATAVGPGPLAALVERLR